MTSVTTNTNQSHRVQWYVMRAYKNEKRAEEILSGDHGLPFFIPKRYILQTVHGKQIRRLVPTIPGMIFVRASRVEINEFKSRCPFIQYVVWKKRTGSEYLVVPEKEMDSFIKVTTQEEAPITYYPLEEINFKKGTPVRITGGTFDGVEGTFVKVKGKRNRRLVVNLPHILAASVEVEPQWVEAL